MLRPGLLIMLVAAGCVRSRTAPAPLPERLPTEVLSWNGVRASWRAFPPGAICDTEPRFLRDELLSVNEMLRRFLRDTEGDATAPWPDAQQALVFEGERVLAPMLEVHARNLGELERCRFKDEAGYPVVRTRGRELLEATRLRWKEAPAIIAEVRRARAREAWERERLASQEAARQTCPSVRVGAVVIYFAFRDLEGTTSFFFCDGATVTQREGQPAAHEPPPPGLIRRRLPPAKTYLTAAARYAPTAIFPPPEQVEAGQRESATRAPSR